MKNYNPGHYQGVRTNGGIFVELRMAASVAHEIADFFRASPGDLFAADHDHEDLPEGAASISGEEGPEGWTYTWTNSSEGRRISALLNVFVEPINNSILAIYPGKNYPEKD